MVESTLSSIWNSWGPSKMVVFSWQLMHDRISTRENLLKRGITIASKGVFFPFFSRFPNHRPIFITCEVVDSVWYMIFSWLESFIVLPRDFLTLLFCSFRFDYPSRLRGGGL